jgi:hypothetical protein
MRSQIINSLSRLVHPPVTKVVPAAKAFPAEESLVVDERVFRRPAQVVEDKLIRMLETSCIGISQLRLKDLLSGRATKQDRRVG